VTQPFESRLQHKLHCRRAHLLNEIQLPEELWLLMTMRCLESSHSPSARMDAELISESKIVGSQPLQMLLPSPINFHRSPMLPAQQVWALQATQTAALEATQQWQTRKSAIGRQPTQ